MMRSVNPATDETLASFEEHDAATIDQRLARAAAAQRDWARTRWPTACRCCARWRGRCARTRRTSRRCITLEMGKPLAEAVGEVEKCAWNFDFYADAAPGFLQDQVVASSASDSRIVYDPLGLVLAVMPWNYPLWQVMRAAAPVLAGGNGLVLKHASNVPQCALAIESAVRRRPACPKAW